MKYAIISDIHGNIHAFEAVLADAKAQNVDKYLLIGDYATMHPFGNEVAERIRTLENAVVVRGNGEDHLINLLGKTPEEMTSKQFFPTYWSFNSLSAENREYITTLPEAATITDGGWKIHLQHASNLFFSLPRSEFFYSYGFSKMMIAEPFTHQEYLTRAKCALLSNPENVAEILQMSKGIYLFGHNHLQFHMENEGRIFINPGSCGDARNWDNRAQYTILTIDDAQWHADERRIEYDIAKAVEGMQSTGYAEYTPAWSKVMEYEVRSGKDYFISFLPHITAIGEKMGISPAHGNNEVYDEAVKTWDIEGAY